MKIHFNIKSNVIKNNFNYFNFNDFRLTIDYIFIIKNK